MKVLIVDDEALARERLSRMLLEMDGMSIVGEASNGPDALRMISELAPDVILLDIKMPGMDGMEVARHLTSMDYAPSVIFTTAYDEYAIEAFRVHAVDYLLKPISDESLKDALMKVRRVAKSKWRVMADDLDGQPRVRTHISSRTRQGIALVRVDEIYYFKAEHKYVTVCHKGGEVLIEEPLKDLEIEFQGEFLRIHRNCLVAVRHLKGLKRNTLGHYQAVFRDFEEQLDVSRRHVSKVRQFLSKQ